MSKTWYAKKTGADQGLIYDEDTGKNIAVSYDAEDAELIAAAPELLDSLVRMREYTRALFGVAVFRLGFKIEDYPELKELCAQADWAISKATQRD